MVLKGTEKSYVLLGLRFNAYLIEMEMEQYAFKSSKLHMIKK